MARSTDIIHRIATYKVRSPKGMADFIGHVFRAIGIESRRSLGRSAFLAGLERQARGTSKANVASLAPMFALIRDFAAAKGAPQVAGAVVQAAAWFWRNVEQPAQGGGGSWAPPEGSVLPSAGGGGDGGNGGSATLAKITDHELFWPVIVGGVGILAVVGILLVPSREA